MKIKMIIGEVMSARLPLAQSGKENGRGLGKRVYLEQPTGSRTGQYHLDR